MIFPDWHRLVDLHEQQIRALLAHGIPIEIQKAAFEEAMNRVERPTVAGVAEVSGESWRAPAQKSSKALVVYRALPAQMSSQNLQPELNHNKAAPTKKARDNRSARSNKKAEVIAIDAVRQGYYSRRD